MSALRRVLIAVVIALAASSLASRVASAARDGLSGTPDLPGVQTAGGTGTAGGGGGDRFELRCPQNYALIGIEGKSGLLVDRLRAVCGRFNERAVRGDVRRTNYIGGTGGADYSRLCPDNRVIAGFEGTYGYYVHRLTVVCAAVYNDNGNLKIVPGGGGVVRLYPTLGTTPGGRSYSLICPDRRPGVAVVGREGTWIDAIGLSCIPGITLQ